VTATELTIRLPSRATAEKGIRLWDEGRVAVGIVEPDGPSGPSYLALVRGDSNSYAVTCGPHSAWRCPCRASVVCAHLLACWRGLMLRADWPQWRPSVGARLNPELNDHEENR
jgi:hypothetical protein